MDSEFMSGSNSIPRWTRFLVHLLCVGFSACVLQTSGRTIYVGKAGDGVGGLSWASALTNVQQAINQAADGDVVWVAAGTYDEHLVFKEGVKLYGGFAGVETGLEERNFTKYLTILDGGNTDHVALFLNCGGASTILDGCVIQNGTNLMGGGIYCSNASPLIANCVIVRNSASGGGGGIQCDYAAPVISNNVIKLNWARLTGGGLSCWESSPTISNNRFRANSSGAYQSEATGGGISCLGKSSPLIANNSFIGNYAGVFQGVGRSEGGAIFGSGTSRPAIINNTLIANSAATGGAVVLQTNAQAFANNLIAFNSTVGLGYSPDSVRTPDPLLLSNNCFYGNGDWPTNIVGTNGNISANPGLLTNATSITERLLPDSPCRDAGNSDFVGESWKDIALGRRTEGSAVDIGADESDGTIPTAEAGVIRVSIEGENTSNGLTWDTAMRTIRSAISALPPEGGEIWIASGVFTECVVLPTGCQIYGGFSGVESSRPQRDWTKHSTVIDGAWADSVISIYSGGYWAGIDGVTVTNGRGRSGGGVLTMYGSPFISHCTIASNTAPYTGGMGGGIYCHYSAPSITNNNIAWNHAYAGGGVGASFNSPALLANNRITENAADGIGNVYVHAGGGIFSGGTITIVDNLIAGNAATGIASLRDSFGGGIYVDNGEPLIANNTILNNDARSQGNGTLYSGGGIYCKSGSPEIANNLVAFNASGLWLPAGSTVLNNCVYSNGYFDYSNFPNQTGTNGNIALDPKLAGSYLDGHLQAGSPCIDAGINSVVRPGDVDLDGTPRLQGQAVDIGVDEYDNSVFKIVSFTLLAPDQIQFQVIGNAPLPCVVEESTNLLHWVPVVTNQGVPFIFRKQAPASSGGFYRARNIP